LHITVPQIAVEWHEYPLDERKIYIAIC